MYVITVILKWVIWQRVTGKPYSSPDQPPLPKMNRRFPTIRCHRCRVLRRSAQQGSKSLHLLINMLNFTNCTSRSCNQYIRRILSSSDSTNLRRKLMISDNAAALQAAYNYIQRMFESHLVQDNMANMGTRWTFIHKHASRYGGFWEGLMKQPLRDAADDYHRSRGHHELSPTDVSFNIE